MSNRTVIRCLGVLILLFSLFLSQDLIGNIVASDKRIDIPIINNIIFSIRVIFLILGTLFIFKSNIKSRAFIFISYGLYFISLLSVIFVSGGLFVLFFDFTDFFPEMAFSVFLVVYFIILVCLLSKYLLSYGKKLLLFRTVLFVLIVFLSLYLLECSVYFFVPHWPVSGLRGLDIKSINYCNAPKAKFNSWGLIDRERNIVAEKDIKRTIFVGDSFLEVSNDINLPLLVEDKLSKYRFEVINLGLSSTSPDEYFYRIKNIGLSLKPSFCFVFIFARNDFIQEKSLLGFLGIVAVYPKDSFFSLIGLKSINYILTNKLRPLIRNWDQSDGDKKLKNDLTFTEKIKSNNKILIEDSLLNSVSSEEREKLKKILSKKDLELFLNNINHGDNGSYVFRQDYLWYAARCLLEGQYNKQYLSEEYAYKWIKRIKGLCAKKNIKFVCVFIPEAFTVDRGLQDLWAPLIDMKEYSQHFREVTERTIDLCKKDKIDYIDLYPVLKDCSGCYLNLDGHWSNKGVLLVSDFLAKYMCNMPTK
ncbi:MAG: hypothetical protein PHO70_04745 [Candidatus Omnitrophica bacterium]|nr:hypothetical protein [Candidatus Omnitrophota bacterium]